MVFRVIASSLGLRLAPDWEKPTSNLQTIQMPLISREAISMSLNKCQQTVEKGPSLKLNAALVIVAVLGAEKYPHGQETREALSKLHERDIARLSRAMTSHFLDSDSITLFDRFEKRCVRI